MLSCRSDTWGVASLSEVESLDWSHQEEGVSTTLLDWVYTDHLTLPPGKEGDKFTLALMAAASSFCLGPLVDRCEQSLMSSVSVNNCISFYATAHEIQASKLASHCSQLISANRAQFTHTDFSCLAAELVFSMLQERASHPLHSAISLRREDVVFLCLIQFHAQLDQRINEPDEQGRLPLDLALVLGEQGIATSLVEHGVNVSERTVSGSSLLHLAIQRRDPEAALFLLRNGVQTDMVTASCSSTALHMVAEAVCPSLQAVAELLTELGAGLDLQDREGETALCVAVRRANTPVLELLIKSGADLEVVTVSGRSALCLALQGGEGHEEQDSPAALLVKAGADPSALCDKEGGSILHSLADMGREEAGLYLVSVGANVNLVNKKGETVLHLAAHRGSCTVQCTLYTAHCKL